MDKYTPPYDINDEMLELVSEIMENLGKLSSVNELERIPKLRKVNRIRSIHSSLAIENNTLSIEQVTDLINGKRVLGPKKDIIEVNNANLAYAKLNKINPYSIKELLLTHEIMMDGLVNQAGKFRSGKVGVFNEKNEIVHLAPPEDLVPNLINQLFDWIKTSNANMLIKSSVFHYEFEFIHPFNDGNGRMGRLWQTALLASWKPIFAWVPIESIIRDNQEDYYKSITLSTSQGKSNVFILFMLNVINKAIKDIITDSRNHNNHLNNQITKLMKVMESYPQSASELMKKLNLKSRDGFRKNYIQPSLEAGLIGMTDPNKPTSRNQKYFKV